jgi:hypothetical protein
MHPFAASERRFAFPPGWEHLADTPIRWHSRHLSGGSSQVLALALLQAAVAEDPSLGWLWPRGGLLPPIGEPVEQHPEFELETGTLEESKPTTALDWFVHGSAGALAVETKFMEEGFDPCSCAKRRVGDCSQVIRGRPYWAVARTHFGLHGSNPPEPCPLSVTYQPVRNAAAALALADGGQAVFLLIYDDENPYFAGAGEWPGWAAMLDLTPAKDPLAVRTASWQQLLAVLPLPDDVRTWACEKHGLAAA